MSWHKKIVLLLAVALLLSSLPVCSVEYKPGEKVAEDLFNHGIGKPWVGGDSPKSTYGNWPRHVTSIAAIAPYSSYEFIGYLNVAGSMSIISDSGNNIQILAGPGSYPLFGYYLGGRLVGIVMDFSDSGRPVQVYPY